VLERKQRRKVAERTSLLVLAAPLQRATRQPAGRVRLTRLWRLKSWLRSAWLGLMHARLAATMPLLQQALASLTAIRLWRTKSWLRSG
jgi:hypothetical protein